MLDISEELRRYISESSSRYFEARIDINGNPVNADIRSLNIRKGSCDGSSFQPASIFSSSLSATLDIKEGYEDIRSGDKVEVYFRCPLCSDKSWYKACTMYASKPSKKIKRVNLTAEGSISAKLGRKYVGSTPTTINELIAQINAATGVNIILDGLDGSYAINGSAKLSNLLYREIVSYIAGCFFGCAHENSNNDIVIRAFGNVSGKSVTLKNSRMFEEAETFDTAVVEGIQITSSDGDNEIDFVYPENTSVVNCSLNNPLMTQELFNAFVENYTGFSYTPHNSSMTLGDFSVEPVDTIIIEKMDARSGSIATVPMSIEIQYDGALKTELSAPTIDNGEDFSRSTTGMESNIAYSNYPYATPSTPSVPSNPDVTEDEVIDTSVPVEAGSTKVGCEAGIYKGYMCFVNLWGNFDKDMKPYSFNLPSCYVPAYPVTVTALGRSNSFAGGNYISVGENEYTAMQITILPEVDPENSSRVHIIASGSYLSPRDVYAWTDIIGDPLEKPEWEYPDGRDLAEKSGFRFETFYILKDKYDDFINGRL